MRAPLASILTRFDPPTASPGWLIDFDREVAAADDTEPGDPVADAFHRGVEEARAEAAAGFEAALEAQAKEAEDRLAALRAEWISDESQRLEQLLMAGLADIETRLSDSLSAVLTPLVESALRDRMVAAFAEALKRIVAGAKEDRRAVPVLSVSGPADLIAALEAKLGDADLGVAYTVGPGVDLCVTLDDTVLRSRCADWLGGLALGETDPCR